jgi:ABC transporter substrate binding protein
MVFLGVLTVGSYMNGAKERLNGIRAHRRRRPAYWHHRALMGTAASTSSAALVRRKPRSFSITRMAFSRAATMSSLAWIALSIAAISRTLVEGTWLKMLRYQCTTQRCQAASGKNSDALSASPRQASEVMSRTPFKPRSLRFSPTTAAIIADVRAVAASLGRHVEIVQANTSREIDAAIASSVQKQADALLVGTGPPFAQRRVQLATLTARHAVPAMFADRQYVEAGGLMSYASSIPDAYRQAGLYVGRILKGEKPADLPVTRSTKFEFVINLKTAKALGLTVPDKLLATADEVIE